MAATNTGRLSSTDPNLQNIPIRTEEGKKIRNAFISDKGFKLKPAIMNNTYAELELVEYRQWNGFTNLPS